MITIRNSKNKVEFLKNDKEFHTFKPIKVYKVNNVQLLDVKFNNYVYYSDETFYKFSTESEILKLMCDGFHQFPYAIDKGGNRHMLHDRIIIINADIVDFDSAILITPNHQVEPESRPAIKHFRNIAEFFIDGTKYPLKYHPFPAKNYSRLKKTLHFGSGMEIVLTNGERIPLDKKKYVELIENFGETMGFKPFQFVTIF